MVVCEIDIFGNYLSKRQEKEGVVQGIEGCSCSFIIFCLSGLYLFAIYFVAQIYLF